jgi:hypothetical protein
MTNGWDCIQGKIPLPYGPETWPDTIKLIKERIASIQDQIQVG